MGLSEVKAAEAVDHLETSVGLLGDLIEISMSQFQETTRLYREVDRLRGMVTEVK